MKEIWKEIDGFPNYEVSNLGRVRSKDCLVNGPRGKRLRKGKVLKGFYDKDGYRSVGIYNNRSPKCCRVHRLVALMFIPNPKNLEIVNHIDHDKANNCLSNLEWVTTSENITKYIIFREVATNRRVPRKRDVLIINIETGIYYETIKEASEASHLNYGAFIDQIRNRNINRTQFRVA